MTTRRQDTTDHRCGLSNEPENIVNTFIEQGLFVNLRRKIKRYMIVSTNHPLSRFYINSLSRLRAEERRHLIRHYKMIHPFSMFNFYWKIYMFFIIFGTHFVWPLMAAYVTPGTMNKIMAWGNGSFLILIILSFCTGYHDKAENHVVLSVKKVAVRYITTYFFFDIFTIATVVVRILSESQNSKEWTLLAILSWFLPLCKFARYPYFLSSLREMKLYFGMNHFLYQALVTFFSFMFFLLIMVTIIYVIIGQFSDFANRSHLDCVQSSIQMILMVSHGYHNTDHFVDKLFPILFITFGFIVHLLIIVFIMQIWYQFYSTENQQINVYNSIKAFMTYQALPLDMRERIFLYLDFKYQRHFYKDSSILRATSPSLRKEILVNISMASTQKVDIFKSIPEKMLEKVRAHLVSKIFLPGDIIIKAGTRGRSMYFIKRGTVKITTPDKREFCRLRDGAHFGEIALVANVPRVADITAVTACELFVLNRKSFLEVFSQHPDILKNLTNIATERIAGIQTFSHQDDIEPEVRDENESKELEIIGDEIDESTNSVTKIY